MSGTSVSLPRPRPFDASAFYKAGSVVTDYLGKPYVAMAASTGRFPYIAPSSQLPSLDPAKTYYVDGKTGNDSNAGTSAAPFKTIAHAANAVPTDASDWTVVVVGYDDWKYNERAIPGSYSRNGSQGHPLTFQAANFSYNGSYIKPIVTNSLDMTSGWTQPNAGTYPNVWAKTVSAGQVFSDTAKYSDSLREDRIYVDITTTTGVQSTAVALRRPATASLPFVSSLTTVLTQIQATASSYYYSGEPGQNTDGAAPTARTFYVNLTPAAGVTMADTNPNNHTISALLASTMVLANANHDINIRGFRVYCSDLGYTYKAGTYRCLLEESEAAYCYDMGVITQGTDASTITHDITIRGCTFFQNSLQAWKCDLYTEKSLMEACDCFLNGLESGVKFSGTGCQYNTVRYTRMRDGNNVPAYDRHSNWIEGALFQTGAQYNTIQYCTISNNGNGVHTYQTDGSHAALTGNLIDSCEITGSHNSTVDSGYAFYWNEDANSGIKTGVMTASNNWIHDNDRDPTTALTGTGVTGKTISGTVAAAPSPLLPYLPASRVWLALYDTSPIPLQLNWRGTWSSALVYNQNDYVTDGTQLWIALRGVPAGTSLATAAYWSGLTASSLTNPMTTAGDLIVGGASGAASRLAVGTSTQVLAGGSTPAWGPVPAHASRHLVTGADALTLHTYLGLVNTRAETYPRDMAQGTVTLATGVCYLIFFTSLWDLSVSNIEATIGTAAVNMATARMGLFTAATMGGDVTLVARTAEVHTTFAASPNVQSKIAFDTTGGFPASYTLVSGSIYAASVIVVGGGSPTYPTLRQAGVAGSLLALAPALAKVINSQSDLPTGTTSSAGFAGGSNRIWFGLS